MKTGFNDPQLLKLLLDSPLVDLIKKMQTTWKPKRLNSIVRNKCKGTNISLDDMDVSLYTFDEIYTEEEILTLLMAAPAVLNDKKLIEYVTDDTNNKEILAQEDCRLLYLEIYPELISSRAKPILEKLASKCTVEDQSTKIDMSCPVPIKQILSMLNIMVNLSVPVDIFGSKGNRKRFMKFVKNVLTSGIHDTIPVTKMMENIKLSACRLDLFYTLNIAIIFTLICMLYSVSIN